MNATASAAPPASALLLTITATRAVLALRGKTLSDPCIHFHDFAEFSYYSVSFLDSDCGARRYLCRPTELYWLDQIDTMDAAYGMLRLIGFDDCRVQLGPRPPNSSSTHHRSATS